MVIGTDVIRLGRHRLVCGDATNKEDVKKLLQGEVVDLLLTDAPYGISIVQPSSDGGAESVLNTVSLQHNSREVLESHHSRQNERERANGVQSEEANQQPSTNGRVGIPAKPSKQFLHTPNDDKIIPARTYKPVINDDKPFNPQHLLDLNVPTILFGGNYFADKLPQSNKWLVWYKKPSLDATRNHFSDCELMWTNLPGKRVDCYHYTWSGMVRRGDRRLELSERVHPTQKPVGLLTQLIEDYTERGDTVLDLYGGSGSTLIACEVTGRRCCMMELSRDYVDIIQKRYYAYVRGESTVEVDSEVEDYMEDYGVGGLDSWLT